MFSNHDYYNLASLEKKIQKARNILDIKVKIDALEKILIEKNIIAEAEMAERIIALKSSREYTRLYYYLEVHQESVDNYKSNKQKYLDDL